MNKNANIFMTVNFYKDDLSVGVTKKIYSTINAFRRKGHCVYYTAYGKSGIDIYDNDDRIIYHKSYGTKNERLKSAIHRFTLLSVTRKFLKNTDVKFDVLFSRWLGFDLSYINMLKIAKKKHNAHVVIDMISYFPGIHFDSIKGKYMLWNTNMFHKVAVKYIDSFLVEGELSELFGKKTLQSIMGVEIDNLKEHQYVGDDNETNIISVSNELPYHGYDRLIKSLAEYIKNGGKEIIYIHLVGVVSSETKKLVSSLGLNNNVILYGKKYGDELVEIYSKCNIAAGPVAQHRVGGKKDTGLKTKEYFAIGLPYFFAGEDSVPKSYPYVFRVSDDESFINFDDIVRFRKSYLKNENVVKEMRNYAKEHFSWDKATDIYLQNYYSEVK